MFVKFVSLATLICSVAISSADFKDPTDPLFFIVSGGAVLGIVRILFSLALVVLTFVRLPKIKSFRIGLAIFGLPLMILGLVGLVTNSFDYAWYGLIKPLDYLLIIETGIVMNVLALQPQQQPVRISWQWARNQALLISAFKLRLHKLRHVGF